MTAPEPTGLLDDHGFPAIWTICDDCARWAWCLKSYTEASGPCTLWPYAEDTDGQPMELGDPRLDGEGLMCSACVAVLAMCADRQDCERAVAAGAGWPS